MSRSTTGRRLATSICSSIQQASSTPIRCSSQQFSRAFSNSVARLDDANDQARREQQLSGIMGRVRATQTATQGRPPSYSPSSIASRTARTSPAGKSENMLDLARSLPSANVVMGRALNDQRSVDSSILIRGGIDELTGDLAPPKAYEEPYHFHVYSHKHNCHVTVTKPNRDAILSLSCGNLGFRHAQRKTYDSAYQLGAYVIDKLQQAGWHNKIDRLEVCLRGWGPGREAVTKVLLGTEGKLWRDKIVKVSDSTRLKFGGTRSPNPRRLG